MNVAREQVSLRRSLELALRFALRTNKSQTEALQKLFPRSGDNR